MNGGDNDVIDAKDRLIAEVCEWGEFGTGRNPNARLIAAAPELLEALQEAIPWIEKTGIADSNPPEYLKILAAVRKATK